MSEIEKLLTPAELMLFCDKWQQDYTPWYLLGFMLPLSGDVFLEASFLHRIALEIKYD